MASCSGCARPRPRQAASCARIRRTSRYPGCSVIASSAPTPTVAAGFRPGTPRVRPWSRPTPCSVRHSPRRRPVAGSISSTPPRRRRSPPRGAIDRDALWAGIADGSIDTVATDHVHRDLSGKAGGIWNAAPGCPGLETLLPVMLSEGHCRRGIPLRRIVDLLARNPAQEMGLGHAKGTIAIGRDADVAIVDLKRKWTLERPGVHSSAGYSIYEGWQFQGQVVHTLVRGRAVLRDRAVVPESAGWGRYQHR